MCGVQALTLVLLFVLALTEFFVFFKASRFGFLIEAAVRCTYSRGRYELLDTLAAFRATR